MNDCYVVGWGVHHYRWGSWSEVTINPSTFFSNVWGTSSNDVYVTGADGTVAHFDGSAWSETWVGVDTILKDVWASAPDDVYTIDYGGRLYHYDGSAWSPVTVGIPDASPVPSMIEGAGPDDILISGKSTYYYDGVEWSPIEHIGPHYVPAWINDLICVGSKDYYAVGPYSLYHFDGVAWEEVWRVPVGAGYGHLTAVWAESADEIWMVDEYGEIWHTEDGEIEFEAQTAFRIMDMWGTYNKNVYAVGHDEWIMRYDGNSWERDVSLGTSRITAIWGAGSRKVFAADRGDIYYFDGEQWTHVQYVPVNVDDIWGSDERNVFFVGYGGVARYDGREWVVTPMDGDFAAVWGSSKTDVYAGGYKALLHFDGKEWEIRDFNNAIGVSDIWGRSGSEIYMGGSGGLLTGDGTDWRRVRGMEQTRVFAIWGPVYSPDLFVVCERSIHHFNGKEWSTELVEDLTGDNRSAYTIWGAPEGDVFVGGDGCLLLHRRR
jgi:hypothetical protein